MSGAPPPQKPDPPPLRDEWRTNPYAPPAGELLRPRLPERAFRGMSFGKRLLFLPMWFLLGLVPMGLLTAVTSNWSVTHEEVGYPLVTFGAILVNYFIYSWLVVPFQLDSRRRLKWALLGVPLVALAWAAFCLALLFAVCGLFFRGFH